MTNDKIKTHVNALITRMYTCMYCLFHGMEKKILFMSFGGKFYSDNPRAISEKMHEMYPDYQIEWFLNEKADKSLLPDYVHVVNQHTGGRFALYKAISTSFCFITNNQMTPFVHKRKGQYFIQTWHGDTGMKRILYDAYEGKDKPFPIIDGKVTDLAIAGSDLSVKKYESAFHYHGEILKCGTPRNDKLITRDPDEEKRTRSSLGIGPDTKVLLYAPTFRDHSKALQNINVDLKRVISILNDKNDGEWICLIRAHRASKGLDYAFDNKNYIDVSSYPDIGDLLAISDMLITDYSSCSGDPIRAYIPVILAMFDKEDYTKNYRKLYYDPEEAGFIIAYSQDQLEDILNTYSKKEYDASCNRIMEYFNIYEKGNASEAICRRINDFYLKKNS